MSERTTAGAWFDSFVRLCTITLIYLGDRRGGGDLPPPPGGGRLSPPTLPFLTRAQSRPHARPRAPFVARARSGAVPRHSPLAMHYQQRKKHLHDCVDMFVFRVRSALIGVPGRGRRSGKKRGGGGAGKPLNRDHPRLPPNHTTTPPHLRTRTPIKAIVGVHRFDRTPRTIGRPTERPDPSPPLSPSLPRSLPFALFRRDPCWGDLTPESNLNDEDQ